MNPAGSKPSYACNPTDAAAHLLWCKQEARKELKGLMETYAIPRDFSYEMARAKYHGLKGNQVKVQAITQKLLQMGSPSFTSTPVVDTASEELFKEISGQVTRLFLANLVKNPVCAGNVSTGLMLAMMNKTYADVRNWIEGF